MLHFLVPLYIIGFHPPSNTEHKWMNGEWPAAWQTLQNFWKSWECNCQYCNICANLQILQKHKIYTFPANSDLPPRYYLVLSQVWHGPLDRDHFKLHFQHIYDISRKGALDLKAIYPWAKPVWNSNEGSAMSGSPAPGATRYKLYCLCPGDLVTLWQGQYSLVSWYFIWFHLYLHTKSKWEAFWPVAQLGAINCKTHNTNQGL